MRGKRITAAALCGSLVIAALVSAAPAQAQATRDIYFENKCSHPLRIIIAHAYDEDLWDAHGWYEYSAFEESTQLEDNDEPLTQLEGYSIYFYAESTDGSNLQWEGEDHYELFNEVTYGMVKASVEAKGGHLNVPLTCDDESGE